MTRFFIPKEQFADQTVVINGADRHHLANVLRKKVGDSITVLNGRGQEFTARIMEIGPEQIIAVLNGQALRDSEPRVSITLIQSLPKADKFEWILQKNTEIGVVRFRPVLTERSSIKLDEHTVGSKMARWQKIILQAAEQSGRQVIPELLPIVSWSQVFLGLTPQLFLIPWEGERQCSLKSVLTCQTMIPQMVSVLIGPEGGFSLSEVNFARAAGAIPVSLGPRILRAETAGLVVASAILYHYDDLN
jgi:16S rRNA (uracil1498-N3)-methyltransferase